jgi:adenylate cyclase
LLLATAYANIPKVDSAIFYLEKALEIPGKSEKYTRSVWERLSDLYQSKGDWENAIASQELLLSFAEQKGDASGIAIAKNNIGYLFHKKGEYKEALEYFEWVEENQDDKKWLHRASLFSNMGVAWFNENDLNKAQLYFKKAIAALGDKDKYTLEANIQNLLAKVFLKNEDLYQALQYVEAAEENASRAKDVVVLKNVYNTASEVYQELYDYEKSLAYLVKYLSISDSLELENRFRQQKLVEQKNLLERSEKEIELLMAGRELQALAIKQLELEKDKLTLTSQNLELEAIQQEQKLDLLKSEKEIQAARIRNQELEAKRARQELLLSAQRLDAAKKDKEIALLNEKEARQRLELAEKEAAEKEKVQQIELLTREKKINELELAEQASFRRFAYGLGTALLAIIGLILTGFIFARKTNRTLKAQKEEIESQKDIITDERNKADNLLLNILPLATARELKEKGSAQPRHYDAVTVMFSDFTNFTAITGNMAPEEVVDELNACFKAFDIIIEKYGLEKIKTIGDSYMVAGGVPEPIEGHAEKMVKTGLDMQEWMENRYKEKSLKRQDYWRMRIGIHSGPVVAGVIGQKKFAYDIWGDTVNIASRLEAACEPGRVNISEATLDLLPASCKVSARGEIPAKGKGLLPMYFVDLI